MNAHYISLVALLFSISAQLGLIVFSDSSIAGDDSYLDSPSKFIELQAEAYCSENTYLFQTCFGINEAECVVLFKDIFTACDQTESIYFYDPANQESVNQFRSCSNIKLSTYVEAKGVDLGATCE